MHTGDLSWGRCSFVAGLSAAILLLVHLPLLQADFITIDSFDSPDPAVAFFVPGPPSGSRGIPFALKQAAPEAIGQQRDLLTTVIGTPLPIAAAVMVGYEPSFDAGILAFATFGFGDLGPASYLSVRYDGTDAAGSLANVDLTGDGTNDAFSLRFLGVDAPLPVTVTVSGPDNTSAVFHGVTADINAPFTFPIPFASFTGDDTFGNVTSIEFVFNGPAAPIQNMDFELDSIRAVPEPSTLALLFGCGAFAVIARTRRRQRRPD